MSQLLYDIGNFDTDLAYCLMNTLDYNYLIQDHVSFACSDCAKGQDRGITRHRLSTDAAQESMQTAQNFTAKTLLRIVD